MGNFGCQGMSNMEELIKSYLECKVKSIGKKF